MSSRNLLNNFVQINNISFATLFLILSISSIIFISSRNIKLNWSYPETYLMRFHWLDSVNDYIKTGQILTLDKHRLEDVSTGEDQGYPFLMSVLGKGLGVKEMNFGFFINFNYLLLITLGTISALLIFLTFKSIFLTSLFYFFYLNLGLYDGGIDHHWMIGPYIIFYILYDMLLIKNKSTYTKSLLVIYFLVAGIANVVREGDGFIGILLLISLLIILIVQGRFKKYELEPIFKLYFPNLRKNILIVPLLILVYLAPMLLLNGVRNWRDSKYFNGESSDMITHHGIWHNAFMGLGYIPNKYGIQWNDKNPIKFVKQVNPNVGYMTNEYYSILRSLYFKYSFESPDLWLGNILTKAKAINKLNGEFTNYSPGKFLPQVLRNYFLYISLIGIFILSRKDKVATAIFWLVLTSLLISSIPGFVGTPTLLYLGGLQSAFFITWFYFVSLIFLALKDFLKTRLLNQPIFNFL